MKEVRRAIYSVLSGDATLTGDLGSPPAGYDQSIYDAIAPAGAEFPYVILNFQGGAARYTFDSLAFDGQVWLAKAVDRASTADTADDIAARIDVLLTDATLSITGKRFMSLRRTTPVRFTEEDEGQQYRHSGALFQLHHQPT